MAGDPRPRSTLGAESLLSHDLDLRRLQPEGYRFREQVHGVHRDCRHWFERKSHQEHQARRLGSGVLFYFGAMFGCFIGGRFGDEFGRRKAVVLGSLFTLLG